eukprot:13697574-Ditylum_brightwellii.AAC.1
MLEIAAACSKEVMSSSSNVGCSNCHRRLSVSYKFVTMLATHSCLIDKSLGIGISYKSKADMLSQSSVVGNKLHVDSNRARLIAHTMYNWMEIVTVLDFCISIQQRLKKMTMKMIAAGKTLQNLELTNAKIDIAISLLCQYKCPQPHTHDSCHCASPPPPKIPARYHPTRPRPHQYRCPQPCQPNALYGAHQHA